MTAFRGGGLFTRGGWPARIEAEACWEAVADGRATRDEAHDWTVPWIEGDAGLGRAEDGPTVTALVHLHSARERSLDEIRTGLGRWRETCAEYDRDPEALRARTLVAAMRELRAVRRQARAAEPDAVAVGIDGVVALPLSDLQRQVLRRALLEWGGPAHCTAELAQAMGFQSVAEFDAESRRLAAALDERQPLSPVDWVRLLLSAELVFISDVVGSGRDWTVTTGLSDVETLVALRGLQRVISRRWSLPRPGVSSTQS